MPLYLNELAPWERKREYYHHIQLGKDVNTQTQLLKGAIDNQKKAQLATASAIVASQESLRESLNGVGDGINNLTDVTERGFFDVTEGLKGLQSSFEWGISEVVWQIEQNRKVLKDILEVLMAPLDTQAKELRHRAEDAYANGWYDDALEDFLESEKKNKYDFSVHISLGMIYLFHIIDKKKALDFFDKAIKYAKPKSPYHASYALLYRGLIMRDMSKIEEAEKCTKEAIEICPDFLEAHYQNAQYNALLDRPEEAVRVLYQVLRKDVSYSIKIDSDEVFEPIKPHIDKLLIELRDLKISDCKRIINSSKKELCLFEKKINKVVTEFPKISQVYGIPQVKGKVFSSYFHNIEQLLEGSSILEVIVIKGRVPDEIDQLSKIMTQADTECYEKLTSLEDKHKEILKQLEEFRKSYERNKNRLNSKDCFLKVLIFCGFLIGATVLLSFPVSFLAWLNDSAGTVLLVIGEIAIISILVYQIFIGPFLDRRHTMHERSDGIKQKQVEEKEVRDELQKLRTCLA